MSYPANRRWRLRHPKLRQAANARNYSRGSTGRRRPWTDDEDRQVLAREVSDRELSFVLDRSVRAIQHRRHRLKQGSDA